MSSTTKKAIALCSMVTKDPPPSNVVEDFLTSSQDDTKTVVVEEFINFGRYVIEEDTVDGAGTKDPHDHPTNSSKIFSL